MKRCESQPRPVFRRGITALEVALIIAVLTLIACLLVPLILSSRETARRNACANHMMALAKALETYHDQHQSLPPAGVWSTKEIQSLALHQSRRWDRFVQQNWAVFLLPHLELQNLADQYDPARPIADQRHDSLRTTRIPALSCASDDYNRSDNHYRFEPDGGTAFEFARGNYAINGGTNSFHTTDGSTTTPTGDHAHILIDTENRKFQSWGNGIAGFNKAFKLSDFDNGRATLVAFEEIRAGIHPVDPRGVWSLGMIASSVTWGHGVNGDDYGPNNLWVRSDDIRGCAQLHKLFGADELVRLEMPCVSYIDENQNATARSRHPGGANVAFLDGAVKFIKNDIDPALWHVMHSRETPSDVLKGDFASRLSWTGSDQELEHPDRASDAGVAQAADATQLSETSPSPIPSDPIELPRLKNSLDMEFVQLPSGEYRMGTADPSFGEDLPSETPAHRVRITTPFYLGCTEITQEQYRTVMGVNPSWHQPPRVRENWSLRFPVENVTWREADEFCRKLSELAEERAAGRSYRLPTEAEWEYACRAGKSDSITRESSIGSRDGDMAGIQQLKPMGPVGRFTPNHFGLFDMRGNAWEWCSDWFDRDYYKRSRVDDPAGPAEGYLKLVRGSDWIYVGERCFINYPVLAPWKSSPVIGFRVVCRVSE